MRAVVAVGLLHIALRWSSSRRGARIDKRSWRLSRSARCVLRLLVAALVGAVFSIVTAKCGWFLITSALVSAGVAGGGYRIFTAMGSLAKFFNLFWGWADYKPKDWSSAPYKRGYASWDGTHKPSSLPFLRWIKDADCDGLKRCCDSCTFC